ncbi:MAG TPA: hypothetical protein VIM68_04170, partial [Thermoanaerobaculia bacterium]
MITTSIAITAGTSASTRTIANVFGALPLNVTATSVPSGVTISGIDVSGGIVSASVAATCTATAGANNVT